MISEQSRPDRTVRAAWSSSLPRRRVATVHPPHQAPPPPRQGANIRVLGGAALLTAACVFIMSRMGQRSARMKHAPTAGGRPADDGMLHKVEMLEEKAKSKMEHFEHCKDGEGDKHVSAWKR